MIFLTKRGLAWVPLVLVLAAWTIDFGRFIWIGQTSNAEVAEARWGREYFRAGEFKANEKSRLSMAADLLRRKKEFFGKPYSEVVERLGRPDGYFKHGLYPAYVLRFPEGEVREAWQLVFISHANGIVSDVILQKNCCDQGIQRIYRGLLLSGIGVFAR